MADVIRIEDRQLRVPRKMAPEAAAEKKAVILLFTGIRYERLDGAPAENIAGNPAHGASKKH